MKSVIELTDFIEGAAEEFTDPSIPICEIFARFVEMPKLLTSHDAEDILASYSRLEGKLVLRFGPSAVIKVAVSIDGPQGDAEGVLAFGLFAVTPGLWSLRPSVNLPGLLHAFTVLYDVPVPAPWEREILITG
jgi:hypothetical protein